MKVTGLVRKQQGAALFIALIMLLIITSLAVSSMRETTLEARITGNMIQQKRLTNAAEAALREAEGKLMDKTCTDSCVKGDVADADYYQMSTTADDFTASIFTQKNLDNKVDEDIRTRWYVKSIPISMAPIPDCFLMAPGENASECAVPSFYEVNAQAYFDRDESGSLNPTCGPDALCIRTVVAVPN